MQTFESVNNYFKKKIKLKKKESQQFLLFESIFFLTDGRLTGTQKRTSKLENETRKTFTMTNTHQFLSAKLTGLIGNNVN